MGGPVAGLTHRVAASNTSGCSLEHLGSQPPAHSRLDSALSNSILWLQEAQQRNAQRELACAAARRQRHAAHEARQPGGGAVEIESKSNTAASNRPATSEQMRQRRKELGLLSTKEAHCAVLSRARAILVRAILARARAILARARASARARARARARAAALSRQLWSSAPSLAATSFPGYHPGGRGRLRGGMVATKRVTRKGKGRAGSASRAGPQRVARDDRAGMHAATAQMRTAAVQMHAVAAFMHAVVAEASPPTPSPTPLPTPLPPHAPPARCRRQGCQAAAACKEGCA